MRYFVPPLLSLAIAFGLFWLMQWLITPNFDGPLSSDAVRAVELVQMAPEQQDEPEPEESVDLEAAPEPPPAIPSLKLPGAPTIAAPNVAVAAPSIDMSAAMEFGGASSLGGTFGGFVGGAGSGASAGGYGSGKGFKGSKLVPLSTARPQIPEYAAKNNISGWVELVFVVAKNGKVRNIRIIDAEPKGIFEEAAIGTVSNWIYATSKHNREVIQKVDFDPRKSDYNWR